ncbi:MAG TPA: hypothetical protein VF043_32480, partial [Ktedonobacteraceae bacterium]
ELLPETEVLPRESALATTIRAYLINGDTTLATEHEVIAAEAFIRTSSNLFAVVTSICLLARLYVLQGRLRQAATPLSRWSHDPKSCKPCTAASSTILAWAPCCVSGMTWIWLNGILCKAWRWSRRH